MFKSRKLLHSFPISTNGNSKMRYYYFASENFNPNELRYTAKLINTRRPLDDFEDDEFRLMYIMKNSMFVFFPSRILTL